MMVSLFVPDPIYFKYQSAGQGPEGARAAMTKQLERFQDTLPTTRAIVLSDEERLRLEKLFGGPISDPSQFIEWLEKQLAVQIGGVMVPLSEGQRKRLQGWAVKAGQPVDEVFKDAALKIAIMACGGA